MFLSPLPYIQRIHFAVFFSLKSLFSLRKGHNKSESKKRISATISSRIRFWVLYFSIRTYIYMYIGNNENCRLLKQEKSIEEYLCFTTILSYFFILLLLKKYRDTSTYVSYPFKEGKKIIFGHVSNSKKDNIVFISPKKFFNFFFFAFRI